MTTDLRAAVAHIKCITPEGEPWDWGDFAGPIAPLDQIAIATILNAVASGDLIPRADVERLEAVKAEARNGYIAISALSSAPEVQELIRAEVQKERERADKAEAVLRISIGGCDANNGWHHTPIRLPNDQKYVFCGECGETMTAAQERRHTIALSIRGMKP
jgi:hypothetical protein